jgi:hypothetical protein
MVKRGSWRIAIAAIAGALLTLAGGGMAAAAPSSRAAPQNVSLINKVTLWGETSIDGPALSSITDTFEGVRHITTIGWTGTDAMHHLNLMQSTDDPATGPLTFGNKDTLVETSIARPAVVQFGGGVGGTAVAWVGTDPGHALNVEWDAYNSGTGQKKLTFWGETSNQAPALAFFGGNLILAWTGTDANHSLNVLPISFPSMTPGTKTILSQFSSPSGPDLSVFALGSGNQLVLTWTTTTQHLNLATSTDGVHFTNDLGPAGTLQLSASAPATAYIAAEGGPDYWMAWAGTDPAHFLNIQWTSNFPQWPNAATTKTVLDETAFAGPQTAVDDGLLIAWTGTDPGHTLNVAVWQGS